MLDILINMEGKVGKVAIGVKETVALGRGEQAGMAFKLPDQHARAGIVNKGLGEQKKIADRMVHVPP